MEGHTDRGRLLRPGEYSTKENVIKTLEDSVRNLGFANSGATKSTEVDQEFEELKDLLVPVIEKMIRGELTDEELKRELAEAEKKQDPELDKYLVNIKKNYANDPFKQKISAKYEAEYEHRHLEWINKTEEKNRTGMNIGVLNMPHNAREWRQEQKEELHKFCPVFKYIYDPKDYPKIDSLLAAGCAGYRDKKWPENLMSRCPCLDSSVFAEDPSEKRKTLITVAVGSNYWRLLQYLSDVAQENPHMEFLLYRSMHRYNSMNNKFVIQATKFNKNVFFELNTEYVSKNKEDDPAKTLKILETAEPYCQYMRPYKSINDCYRTTRAIQSNENLTVNYLESSLSLLISSRSFPKFYEEVTKDPSILTDKNLPQILEEIANSGCIELLEKITPLIISVFAEQVRYHMQPAKELVFPRLLGKRLADSFLHAAIRRGDKEMLTAGLILLQSLYKERELVKERNSRYYKKRQDDGEELKDVDMEAWNIYKAKENLLEDLETQLNSDQLNVLEFAIVQQQPEMEEILYEFKMPKKDKYDYLHKYVAFMNGDPEELLADVVPAIGVTYPVLPIASLLPYISRGAQTIFELYAKWGIYEERRHEDMTAALEAVLYPSAACLVGPQLGDDQPLNDMKKTVAALLMAGAEIPPKKNQIKTLPKEIMEMLDYVAEARTKNTYEPDPEPNVETADERVFEFFKH